MTATTTRHECEYRGLRSVAGAHDAGTGKPKRKRSQCCGGSFRVLAGWYGLFLHTSVTGRATYRKDEALSLHRTEAEAERAAEASDRSLSELAIRWVPAD